jgi:hypothetical protein
MSTSDSSTSERNNDLIKSPEYYERDLLLLSDEVQAIHNKLAYQRPLTEEQRKDYEAKLQIKETERSLLTSEYHASMHHQSR